MSRYVTGPNPHWMRVAVAVAICAAATASPVLGQSAGSDPRESARTTTAEETVARARALYGPPTPEQEDACPEPSVEGEIVVCATYDDPEQFRVESSSDIDPTVNMDSGAPRAPDVAGAGIFTGPPTVSGLCLIPPCPPPPALIIDLEAIPEAPAGSDADRVGRGLAPKNAPDDEPTGLPATNSEVRTNAPPPESESSESFFLQPGPSPNPAPAADPEN